MSRGILFWGLLGLLNLAVIGGAFRLGGLPLFQGAREGGQEEEPANTAVPLPSSPPASAVRVDLEEADLLIQTGLFEPAIALCKPASESAAGELRDAFAYRLALSLEGIGRWDDAITAYRVVASRSPAPVLVSAAQLGQGRVWLRMRRPSPSKVLLCDLILRSDEPALRGHPLIADARYFLALALALEAQLAHPAQPLDNTPVSPAASGWPLERALDWGKPAKGRKPAPPPPPSADAFSVKRIGARDQDLLVQATTQQMPLTALLDRLAEQGRLKIEWSGRARQRVEGRALRVALGPLPLVDFLRPICERLGLAWNAARGTLSFTTEEEVPAVGTGARKAAHAARALGAAVLHDPRHSLTALAYLELGNLDFRAGHLNEAMAWYGRLVREWPRSPLVTEAQFNRGLLQRRAGKSVVARQTFYHVVDRAPGHQLTSAAYYFVGRLHLEENDPEQALSPLRRGLLASRGSPLQPILALTVAAAHLLANNPRAANQTLVEHRGLINQPEFHRAAAFLDTFARFRACTDRRQKQRETGDLMACLLTPHDENLLGTPGLLLVGQAYQEVGMHEALIPFATNLLPGLRGPLAVELSSLLADAYLALEKRPAAVKLYTGVANSKSPQAPAARLRLAEIALAEGNARECLQWCTRLLEDHKGNTRGPILRLMASAYERTGEHEKAIRCLSGKPP